MGEKEPLSVTTVDGQNDLLHILNGDALAQLAIQLNPEYVKLIKTRCDVTPGFEFKETAICPVEERSPTEALLIP